MLALYFLKEHAEMPPRVIAGVSTGSPARPARVSLLALAIPCPLGFSVTAFIHGPCSLPHLVMNPLLCRESAAFGLLETLPVVHGWREHGSL